MECKRLEDGAVFETKLLYDERPALSTCEKRPWNDQDGSHHSKIWTRPLKDVGQRFPTFLRSRTTWAPRIVNAYHFFQNNYFDRVLVYSEE